MNTLFLQHAETEKSQDPVSHWPLTEAGRKAGQKLADTGIFDEVDESITSTEPQAVETAALFCKQLQKEHIELPDLNEIKQDKGELLTKEEYDEVKKVLQNLEYRFKSWETTCLAVEQ